MIKKLMTLSLFIALPLSAMEQAQLPAHPYKPLALSLDGGGIRGAFQMRLLSHIQMDIKRPLNEIFDVFAGTSIGGINALGLAQGVLIDTVLNMYKTAGQSIFTKNTLALDGLRCCKYSDVGLKKTLQSFLGAETTVADVNKKTYTVVTSYDTMSRSQFYIASWNPVYANVPLWEAALATSAAPTYFPPHELTVAPDDVRVCLDGGMGENNPVLCALDAAKVLHPNCHPPFVVSIGTGTDVRPIPMSEASKWGLIGVAENFIGITFDASSHANDSHARKLCEPNDYHRLQATLPEDHSGLDDYSESNISFLIDHADEVAKSPAYTNMIKLLQVHVAKRDALEKANAGN